MISTLLGTWQLLSWTIGNDEGQVVSEPFGSSPEGLLVYTDAGWMTAAICRRAREQFPEQKSLRSLDALLLAKAYTSYFHYAGPFSIEGEFVTHTVALSLNPNFVGTQQVRRFVLDGDQLTLSGEESVGTHIRYHKLQWQRLPSLSA